jgi:hypothetical protein
VGFPGENFQLYMMKIQKAPEGILIPDLPLGRRMLDPADLLGGKCDVTLKILELQILL